MTGHEIILKESAVFKGRDSGIKNVENSGLQSIGGPLESLILSYQVFAFANLNTFS